MKQKIMKILKVGAVSAMLVGATFGLAGCGMTPEQMLENPEVQHTIETLKTDSYNKGVDSVEPTTVEVIKNVEVEVTPEDYQALKDYKVELDILKAEQAEIATEINFEVAGKSIKVALGESVGQLVLKDNDLDMLFDGDVEHRGEEYRVVEEIFLTSDVKVGVNGVAGFDKEFSEPVIIFDDEGALGFRTVLKDEVEWSDVDIEHPLELPFNKGVLEVVEWDGTSVRAIHGSEVSVTFREEDGRVFEFDDTEFKIEGVYNSNEGDKVRVSLNGAAVTIYSGKVEELGDYRILAKEIDVDNNGLNHYVDLRIAKGDVLEWLNNGDEYEDAEGEEVEGFKYLITENSIGVVYDEKVDELDEGALKVGEEFDFIGMFKIVNKGFVSDYKKVSLSPNELKGDIPTFELDAGDDDVLILEDEEYEKLYLSPNGTYYKNDDNDFVLVETYPTIVNGDKELAVDWDEDNLSVGGLVIKTGFNIEDNEFFFGETSEESESEEVLLYGRDISNKDQEMWLAHDGLVVEVREDEDKLEFEVPDEDEEDIEAEVIVG